MFDTLDDVPCPTPANLAALQRLIGIATTDTGQSRAVADFLLAWWNASACGGLDLTSLWSLAPSIRDDMLLVIDLIAHHREFPTAYGSGDAFAALVARWRPPASPRPIDDGRRPRLTRLRDASALPIALNEPDPADDLNAELLTTISLLPPAMLDQPPPVDGQPAEIRTWFDGAVLAAIPAHDGTLETARVAARAYARKAKADNTRRAYRAGVRAWCEWCHHHALPCLPANPADVVAFLAAERGRGLSVTTVELRRAAIRYLHFIAGCPVPTAEAQVAETVSGMRRHAADQGHLPIKKLAATADLLRDILKVMPDDPRRAA